MYDVIVIGAGPAGVSLSVYLKRSNTNVMVLDNGKSNVRKAKTIDNYYGFTSIDGESLYQRGLDQLKEIDIPLTIDEVVKIEKEDKFRVYTKENMYEAKIVVLATGIQRARAVISNIKDYESKGVSYCATCDGFFYRNKKIAVVGYGNLAYDEIKYLKNVTNDITLFTNGKDIECSFDDLSIEINEVKINKIIGEKKVESLELADGSFKEADGIFIANSLNATAFSSTLGLELDDKFIKVNDEYMTNLDNLYAIGDIVGEPMQIGKAVSDGIILSKTIIKYLRNNK